MDFFELLRTLEARRRRFGHGGRPDREPARLGQELRLGFAVRDVAGADAPARGRAAARSRSTLLRAARARGADAAAPDAPGARPAVAALVRGRRRGRDQRHAPSSTSPTCSSTGCWRSTIGPGPTRPRRCRRSAATAAACGRCSRRWPARGADAIGPVKLGQAAALGHQVLGPERLTGLVARGGRRAGHDRGVRRRLGGDPARGCRPGSAAPHAALGRGATLGPRVFARQSRIELRVGPLGLADYLRRSCRAASGCARCGARCCTASARPSTSTSARCSARAEIPAARLGAARLGHTAWLAPRARPATPPTCGSRAVVGLAAEGARAAA